MARGWGTEDDARGLERIADALERIADALEAQNEREVDTSFGDPRRLVEYPPYRGPGQPYWVPPTWQPTWTQTTSSGGPTWEVTNQGEGDHLLDPKADHTGEETD